MYASYQTRHVIGNLLMNTQPSSKIFQLLKCQPLSASIFIISLNYLIVHELRKPKQMVVGFILHEEGEGRLQIFRNEFR